MREAAQVLVDAVSVGGLYALTALGIGMIFGVMRLVNFAHADLITFAGYAILVFFAQSTALAVVGAALAAIVLALVTERAAFRPLRGANPETLLVSSFAVSFFLEKTLIMVVGGASQGGRFLAWIGAAGRCRRRPPATLASRDDRDQPRAARRHDPALASNPPWPRDARGGGELSNG